MLSENGRFALETVMERLAEEPDTYDQAEWGDSGLPDCDSGRCVAGHIVATVTKAGNAFDRRLRMVDGTPTRTDVQDAIRGAATECLDLDEPPRLFDPEWPREWLEVAGCIPQHPAFRLIEPSADEAAMVLGAILDGDLDEVLAPSEGLRRLGCDGIDVGGATSSV